MRSRDSAGIDPPLRFDSLQGVAIDCEYDSQAASPATVRAGACARGAFGVVPAGGASRPARRRGKGSRTRSRQAVELVGTPLRVRARSGSGSTAASAPSPLFTDRVRRCSRVVGVGVRRVLPRTRPRWRAKRRGSRGRATSSPAVEREIALDLVKHGLLDRARRHPRRRARSRGWDGAASAAIALGIVLVNFLRRPRSSSAGPRRSRPTAVGGAALGGYIVRLARDPRRAVPVAQRVVDRLAGARLHARRRAPRAPASGRRST